MPWVKSATDVPLCPFTLARFCVSSPENQNTWIQVFWRFLQECLILSFCCSARRSYTAKQSPEWPASQPALTRVAPVPGRGLVPGSHLPGPCSRCPPEAYGAKPHCSRVKNSSRLKDWNAKGREYQHWSVTFWDRILNSTNGQMEAEVISRWRYSLKLITHFLLLSLNMLQECFLS